MEHLSVINTILVPEGMEAEAESLRTEYVEYFSKQTVLLVLLFIDPFQEKKKVP